MDQAILAQINNKRCVGYTQRVNRYDGKVGVEPRKVGANASSACCSSSQQAQAVDSEEVRKDYLIHDSLGLGDDCSSGASPRARDMLM